MARVPNSSKEQNRVATIEPPEMVRQSFVDAGWHPGRLVAVPTTVPVDHPARDVLAAFGGLIIPEREPEKGWPVI